MKLTDYVILLLVCCVTSDNKRHLKMPPKFRREGSSSRGPERVRYEHTYNYSNNAEECPWQQCFLPV